MRSFDTSYAPPGTTIGSVANLAALALVAAADSDLVWVALLKCFWHRDRASVLAVDPMTVIAAAGGGCWERIVSTTSLDWLAQATWGIDPILGSDEAIGTPADPLASADELNRRLSVGGLRQSTTVTLSAGAVLVSVDLDIDTNGYLLTLVGTPTVTTTGTIATYAERTHGTVAPPVAPTESQLTDVGVADWTARKGARLRTTSGTAALAWVAGANPGGAGLNVAVTNRFGAVPSITGTVIPAIVVPVPGVTYAIESLPQIQHLSLRQRPGRPPRATTAQVAFQVKDLLLGGVTQARVSVVTQPLYQANIDGCTLDVVPFSSECSLTQGILVTRCHVGGASVAGPIWKGAANLRDCLVTKSITVAGSRTFNFYQCLAWGVTGTNGALTQVMTYGVAVELKVYDAQFFDCSEAGIELIASGICQCVNKVSGARNGIGLLVGDAGDDAVGGQQLYWNIAADIPNLLGTTTPIRILGSSFIDLTWTNVPFRSDAQRGTVTLVAGTFTVTGIRNALLRGVRTHRNTAGGTPGHLSAPVASRTNTQFVIQSNSAGDVSTVDWEIPPMNRLVILAQASGIT